MDSDERATHERLLELAATVNEVFWVTDPLQRTTLYVSPGYERMFGRRCEALYRNARDWLAAVHRDDRERMARLAEEPATTPVTEQFRIVRPDGAIRTIAVRITPVLDAQGAVLRLAGISEDITDRLALEEQVRQTQKLESLGLLAGGVAHDFNNILAVIGANAGLLIEAVPHTHPDRELVDEIEAAVRRATAMTRQLLAFSRKQLVEPVVLDVNAAVAETQKMLKRMVGDDIVVTTSLDPELARVRIDPSCLVQVLMNLAVNARDAMPTGGTLAIATRNIGAPLHEVMIEVTDTGCGMSPEVMARAFEPFFTTKGAGRGTGLGLSVVHGIVRQAGGHFELDSEPGLGTSLRILLPAVASSAEAPAEAAPAPVAGSERILVVDDDVFVRRATSRALRARGYQVLEASDGPRALEVLAEQGGAVSLLLTDVVMPGMDGIQLARTARERRPSLRVLYMSGYADDAVTNHGLRREEVSLVEKPFRRCSLAGSVRAALDAA